MVNAVSKYIIKFNPDILDAEPNNTNLIFSVWVKNFLVLKAKGSLDYKYYVM